MCCIFGAAVLIAQFVWPFGLTIYYADRAELVWLAAGTAVVAGALVMAFALRRRAPLAAFGLATFIVALPPLITRTAVEAMQIPIAETYLAVSGLIFALTALPVLMPVSGRSALAASVAGAAIVFVLATTAMLQTTHRANSFTVLRHNIAVCEECDMPYRLLGDLYAARPNSLFTVPLYQRAVELNPDEPTHRMALVLAHFNAGNAAAAERELRILVEQHPQYEPGRRVAAELLD